MAKLLPLKFKPGDRVRIRDKEEILRTLDKNGRLENMPFMPQMFEFCGQEFTVFKRAHKTCDTVHQTGGRSLPDTVHLDTSRCNGQAYGGCEAGCLLFWKSAWLQSVDGGAASGGSATNGYGCTEEEILKGTLAEEGHPKNDPVYTCQATDLPKFTKLLKWWDIRQYVEDYRSGNVGLGEMVGSFCYAGYTRLFNLGIGYRALCWIYDRFQTIRNGITYPNRSGIIPQGQPTPVEVLNLQPGELVRVKDLPEILETLDTNNMNRGMLFDAEAVPYCGGTYRVRNQCNRIVEEHTGKIIQFKTATVILEEVYCRGCYSQKRLFCPRAIYSMWREIWLERVGGAATD